MAPFWKSIAPLLPQGALPFDRAGEAPAAVGGLLTRRKRVLLCRACRCQLVIEYRSTWWSEDVSAQHFCGEAFPIGFTLPPFVLMGSRMWRPDEPKMWYAN